MDRKQVGVEALAGKGQDLNGVKPAPVGIIEEGKPDYDPVKKLIQELFLITLEDAKRLGRRVKRFPVCRQQALELSFWLQSQRFEDFSLYVGIEPDCYRAQVTKYLNG